MKKRCIRTRIAPMPPRGLRPKFRADELRTLALAHHVNLDDVAHGRATLTTLRDLAESCYTWGKVAELLGVGVEEMARQTVMVAALSDRFVRTGRVGFSGQEYRMACEGVAVMDALAAETDVHTARAAAQWSADLIARTVAQERRA